MKRFILAASAAMALNAGQAFAGEDWKLAKNVTGIKVYVRDLPGSPLREFRGEVELRTTQEQIVRVLKDANSFRKWMPDVAASDLLKSTQNEQFHYLENKTPWPVSHRDGIYHFSNSRSGEGATAIITILVEAMPNYLPPREGKVRIPKADGLWRLTPTTEGVSVVYQMHAAPGGAIPGWLANQSVVDTPFETLKGLRDYLTQSPQ